LASHAQSTPEWITVSKAITEELDVAETSVVFCVTPSGVEANAESEGEFTFVALERPKLRLRTEGDVLSVLAECLDSALWKIGGAPVALRLVQLANASDFSVKFYTGHLWICIDAS
jgi:hypothetical protein